MSPNAPPELSSNFLSSGWIEGVPLATEPALLVVGSIASGVLVLPRSNIGTYLPLAGPEGLRELVIVISPFGTVSMPRSWPVFFFKEEKNGCRRAALGFILLPGAYSSIRWSRSKNMRRSSVDDSRRLSSMPADISSRKRVRETALGTTSTGLLLSPGFKRHVSPSYFSKNRAVFVPASSISSGGIPSFSTISAICSPSLCPGNTG
mmetsp:Transcript_6295/g.26757  ORF Transcript_6295/g.26757 Transcript_6295/m.26757 type:complete len:206 (+) Transcript_6295:1837-2454(+)